MQINLLRDGVKRNAVLPTDVSKKLSLEGQAKPYAVYRIRLDWLYYNDQNDRIATWISQYKSEHPEEQLEDMAHDERYNSIIQEFITHSNPDALKKTKNNIAAIGQQEPGVVLCDGRIIDGNRRFTCLRNIEKETGVPQYFEAVILDRDIKNNEKQIKLLELMLQHGVDKPVDYDPIDRLVGIYNDIVNRQLLTVKEYAKSVNQSESDIQREVEKANLMVEFLEFINAPKQFHLARTMDLNDPLKDLAAMLKRCKDDDRREDLKNVGFANLLMRPYGDMTRYIRKIGKIAANPKLVDTFLEDQLPLTEEVCDLVESQETINEQTIREKIRSREDVKDALSHSTEKWVARADSDTRRNLPAQQTAQAYNKLDEIDLNILKKLNEEQREEVRKNLDLIQDILENIRGTLDV